VATLTDQQVEISKLKDKLEDEETRIEYLKKSLRDADEKYKIKVDRIGELVEQVEYLKKSLDLFCLFFCCCVFFL